MKFCKMLAHDFRFGLIRFRYLLTIPIFIIPCIQCSMLLNSSDITASWFDYIIYCFAGLPSVETLVRNKDFKLPIFWLLQIVICLYLSLDYILYDLSNSGSQVIIRGGSRTQWFISKCLWNLSSIIIYFMIAWLTVFLSAICAGAKITLHYTDAILYFSCNTLPAESAGASSLCNELTAFALPLATYAALNMLQMTLSVFLKPVIAFLICVSLPIIALFWNSSLVLGNGAILLRNDMFTPNGNNTISMVMVSLFTILMCILLGCFQFKKYDILGRED